MTVFVALLRGINVGGNRKLPMATLRAIAESRGLTGARTYIQSGNLVFSSGRSDSAAIAAELRSAISAELAMDPPIVVRTRAELAEVVESNPFLASGADPADPAHLHVMFTDSPALDDLLRDLDRQRYLPDLVEVRGPQSYLHLPNGLGRSKLALELTKRTARAAGTMRNWNTVTRLLRIAYETPG